jgi:hypothetical protein
MIDKTDLNKNKQKYFEIDTIYYEFKFEPNLPYKLRNETEPVYPSVDE